MPMNDSELDRIFVAIRDETAHPTVDLRARMLADACQLAPKPMDKATPRRKPAAAWLERIADAFGGWMSVGGLTACLAIGITFGAAPEGLWAVSPAVEDEPITLFLSLGETLFAEVTQ